MHRTHEETVLTYVDPEEGFRGWAAFHGNSSRLAAGGFRVQAGLTEETVRALARTMSLKQRLLGLAVDGAKVGIDFSPWHPHKREAMRRFIRFLRPHLLDRLSIGPDMGTTWGEIEGIAREEGLPSVKVAIARAQGLDLDDFLIRLQLLDASVDGQTLAQRRAGHALAHAALAAARHVGVPPGTIRAGMQGFGTLARGAAGSLREAGARLVAVADEHVSLIDGAGLDVRALLAAPQGERVGAGTQVAVHPPATLFETPVDVIILAACEDAMTESQARRLPARAVVVGANLGLTTAAESILHERNVLVVPDFLGGCGGPASMDALFGAPSPPTAEQVLEAVGARAQEVVRRVLEQAAVNGMTPRQAALEYCEMAIHVHGTTPYGRWSVSPRRATV